MALAAQALAAKKASNLCEQGEALEGMAARIERLMGLTFELSGCEAVRLSDGLEHLVGVKLIA